MYMDVVQPDVINLEPHVFCCVLLMLAQDYCHDFTGGSLSPSERVIGELIQHYLSNKILVSPPVSPLLGPVAAGGPTDHFVFGSLTGGGLQADRHPYREENKKIRQ